MAIKYPVAIIALYTLALSASISCAAPIDDALRETGDAPPKGHCSGFLAHKKADIYYIGGNPKAPNDEGICLFLPVYNPIVLKACKVGKPCTIYGSVEDCKNYAECTAVTRITSATAEVRNEVYLDKLDKDLDSWWNKLDEICRGYPGNSSESDLACKQRLELDAILKKKGCRNIYPATNPKDTSYWICQLSK
jgi:hypothetical protein